MVTSPRKWLKRLAVLAAPSPVKLVVGASSVPMAGWVVTDLPHLDIAAEADWRFYFAPASVGAILAEHVWEHLAPDHAAAAARLCHRYLRPGARLRIAVPDGLHPDPAYREAVRPGGSGPGADDHKVLYTAATLRALLEGAGFQVRLLEHFGEDGAFHAEDWSPESGMIRRSRRFDPRNRDGALRYTSIIADAFKPS
jgi:predicted SAM-dependent methyltransferase